MYQFRLEALLNHRRCQEELCQKKLAQAQRRLSDEEEKLNSKKKVKRESLEKLQSKKKKNTTVPDILLYMNYITKLSRDIEEQTMRVCKIEKLVDQRRQELVSTMKKRKILKQILKTHAQGRILIIGEYIGTKPL